MSTPIVTQAQKLACSFGISSPNTIRNFPPAPGQSSCNLFRSSVSSRQCGTRHQPRQARPAGAAPPRSSAWWRWPCCTYRQQRTSSSTTQTMILAFARHVVLTTTSKTQRFPIRLRLKSHGLRMPLSAPIRPCPDRQPLHLGTGRALHLSPDLFENVAA